MEEDKRLYLTFLQSVITRMNSNSFDIKKWSLAIITAYMGAYATKDNLYWLIIGIIICVIFWMMDAYYLRMERQYRHLFEDVRKSEKINEDKMFYMKASNYKENDCKWWLLISANTVWPIYLLPIIVMIAIFYY